MKRFWKIGTGVAIVVAGIYVTNTGMDDPIEKFLGGGVLAVATGYSAYWASYMQKKGENLATKEDVEAITNITSRIEREFEVVNENRLSLQSLRRKAIIDTHDGITQLIANLVNFWFDVIDPKEQKARLLTLQTTMINAEGQLSLFDDYNLYDKELNFINGRLIKLLGHYLTNLDLFIGTTDSDLQNRLLGDYNEKLQEALKEMQPYLNSLSDRFKVRLAQTLPAV